MIGFPKHLGEKVSCIFNKSSIREIPPIILYKLLLIVQDNQRPTELQNVYISYEYIKLPMVLLQVLCQSVTAKTNYMVHIGLNLQTRIRKWWIMRVLAEKIAWCNMEAYLDVLKYKCRWKKNNRLEVYIYAIQYTTNGD